MHTETPPAAITPQSKSSAAKTLKKDKQLAVLLFLKDFASWIDDVKRELTSLISSFPDRKILTWSQRSALCSIEKSIIPFISNAQTPLHDAVNSLSPISCSDYVHQFRERKRKKNSRQMSTDRISKSSPLKRIENFSNEYPPIAQKKPKLGPNPKSVTPKLLFPTTNISPHIPPPANGSTYMPEDVVKILTKNGQTRQERAQIIQYMISGNKIPIKREGIYKLLKRSNDGKQIRNTWNAAGRARLLDDTHIDRITNELIHKHGLSIGTETVKKKIMEVQESKAVENGLVPILNSNKPCRSSLSNYMALLATQPGINICKQVIDKTKSRYTAENSLISAMALLCVVAATHIFVVPKMISDIYHGIKECSKGVRLLFDMVSKVHGNLPLFVAHPDLVFSTDDTVQYIFEGKGVAKEKYRLVSSNTTKSSGTRAKYNVTNSQNMQGMRVKLTYTFSAAGMNAPLFITVTGLSERELPMNDCVKITIPGLCVGGGGVTLGNNVAGIIVFMRGGPGMEVARYKIYRDNILIPFIKQTRRELHGWKDGQPIPNDLRAICWSDGDLSQIETIVDPQSLEIYMNNLITACKQNPGRTGTEQPADLTLVFRIMKQLQLTFRLSDVPSERHPMKNIITKAFAQLRSEGRLCLKTNKSRALIDFISSLPEMTAKAITRNSILQGFLEAGYIDKLKLRYPDLNKIIVTCRRNPTEREYALCIEKFPTLLKMFLEKGYVEDSIFEEMGFPMDQDPEGNRVSRDAGIQQESRQRAKILTIKHQTELRASVQIAIESEKKRKANDKKNILRDKIHQNELSEKKICSLLGKPNISREHMSDATHEILYKLTGDELKAFILARNDKISKSNLPKKGKIGDAIQGENNLIKIAYELRNSPIILILEEDSAETLTRNEQASMFSTINEHSLSVSVSGDQQEKSNTASSLLDNEGWMQKVDFCFNSKKKMNALIVSSDLRLKADNIEQILKTRLD